MQRHSCLRENNQVINLRQDDAIIDQAIKSLQGNEDMISPEDSEVKIEEINNEPEENIQKTKMDIDTPAGVETTEKIKRKETRGRKKKTADFFVDPEVEKEEKLKKKQARIEKTKLDFQKKTLQFDTIGPSPLVSFENLLKKMKQEKFELNATSKVKTEDSAFFCAEEKNKNDNGEHKCTICDKIFKSSKALKLHNSSPRSHVPEDKRFYCYRNKIKIIWQAL